MKIDFIPDDPVQDEDHSWVGGMPENVQWEYLNRFSNSENQMTTSPHQEKLEAAKAYLGERWVLHPLYNRNPAHSARDAYFLRTVRKEAVLYGRI